MAQLAVAAVVMAGQYMGGRAAKKGAINDAKQLQKRAGQTRATAQRAAIEERRDAKYLMSRARALAAASGGGVSDPSVVNILGDIEAEGEYNALARMYEGETAAQSDQAMAKARRSEGNAAMNASYFNMASTAASAYAGVGGKIPKFSTGTTFASKYGGGGISTRFRSAGPI